MGGSLKWEEIYEIYKKYPQYKTTKIFVETGTYKGETTRMASSHFEKIYTMEIKKDLYEESKNTGEKMGCKNITYFLGDSINILKVLVPLINDSAIYFLDAHISGSDSGFNGKQYVPLMEEINIILENNKNPCIYIIDDLRFFINDNKPWDWAHISINNIKKLFEINKIKIFDDFAIDDRYVILTC